MKKAHIHIINAIRNKVLLIPTCLMVGILIGLLFPVSGKERIVFVQTTKFPFPMAKEKKAITEDGNTGAYYIVMDSIRTDTNTVSSNYFGYSLIMACVHHYAPANYDVYRALTDLYQEYGLGEMDKDTKEFALAFLRRGAKLGDSRAMKEINSLENR